MMFTEAVAKRTVKFIMRMLPAEREFLEAEAKRRGIHVTSLIRECIRKHLKPPAETEPTKAE